MIYAMSDIHGCYDAFMEAMDKVDLSEDGRLVLLGDYIDGGPESGQVLRHIYDLQKEYGNEKVVVLRGNHEQMLLDWTATYTHTAPRTAGHSYDACHEWLIADTDLRTFRSLVPAPQYSRFAERTRTATTAEINITAARMVLNENAELIRWMKGMPLYYETENLIFAHAGIDEDAGELWKTGTPDWMFLQKYPPTTGAFFKTIIAGHVGTCNEYLSGDSNYHDIYYDGESHFYVDGTTVQSGKVPVLALNSK